METAHEYPVNVTWKSDRKGELSSPDLTTTFEVATPPQFAKGMPGLWSPEHLFTAAINSCLMTTFLAVAENSKLEFESFQCDAFGKLEQVEGKYLMTEVRLEPKLSILREEDTEKAEKVLHKAEAACLISNSVKSKVIMNISIDVVKLLSPIASLYNLPSGVVEQFYHGDLPE
ncbi:MAG: OsmC family protein [Cyclobacteriaceae bacterium]|nr:OsmC family protein [Cyclobacteriaceae bacterium]